MAKLWRVVAPILVFVLLFQPTVQHVLPVGVGSILAVAALTYGIALMFSFRIPAYRRWAIAYLVLIGAIYSLAGLLGLFPSWGLVVTQMWNTSLVSPYPAMSLLVHGVPATQHDTRWAHIGVTPSRNEEMHMLLFSAGVLALGLIAVCAAIGIAWKKGAAYRIWLALAGYFILCSIGYAVACIAGWETKRVILAAGLTISYIVAVIIGRVHIGSEENAG